MSNYEVIEQKLTKFIRKYYVNEIIKGIILFLALGLLYFLFTAIIEYFLWLNPLGRTILFWLFVVVEAALLFKFIGIPVARLFKLFSGIDFRDASTMIGTHFPEVSDKLINVLQLHKNGGDDELTWASINQKSEELKPIPFTLAIDFQKNAKYLKYLAIPVLIIAGLFFTGNNDVITDSASRVADFNNEYIPPAPFTFKVINEDLNTLQNRDFKLNVVATGRKIPENASIVYNGQTYYLTQDAPGKFSFIFNKPESTTSFYLQANEIRSETYNLRVNKVPVINSFELAMDYPAHTGKADEVIKSTGNALVPQGTRITWRLQTTATDKVVYKEQDAVAKFQKTGSEFAFAKAIMSPTKYAISTSNSIAKDYEDLNFRIDITKDEYPELTLEMRKDSINDALMYFKAQVADDYGIRKTQLVYYPSDDASSPKIFDIGVNRGTYDQFFFTFPGNVPLQAGKSYQFYFEVLDNDAVNNFKSAKSQVYSYRKITKDEEEQKQLNNQKESLANLEKSLKDQKEKQQEMDKLSQEQIEKQQRSFNDKRKLDQALKNQVEQEQQMRQQMERLKDNLEKSPNQNDPEKKELEQRIEKSVAEMKKNEELIRKIQEYQDKLSPEELQEQLEKAKKDSKKQQRSLEQLLELTKRYYVKQKFEQLGEKLANLAEKQKKQSEKVGLLNTKADQDNLNAEFKKWQEELRDLEKENDGLKSPLGMDFDPDLSDDIKREQKEASDKLGEQKAQDAQKKQKSAADKMKQLSAAMASESAGAAGEQSEEDAEALRQILDNLVVFSKEQERLISGVKGLNKNSANYGKKLKIQKDLEKAFKHVDDSLFALASRNPKVSENINKEIIDIYYYIDKTLEQLAEFEVNRGVVSQQFTLKGANTLANMLSESLDSMNNSLPMPGKGGKGGEGFQLPDIIKKQESLMKEGEQGKKPGEGKPGSEGESGKSGESGKDGEAGKKGQSGKSGEAGQSGQNGKSGQNGQSGEGEGQSGESGNGKGKGNGKGEGQGEGQGDGNSNGKGKNGKGGSGNNGGQDGEQGYKESEEEAKRIYDIYKQQQELRNQLEDMIRRDGLEGKVGNITEKMKGVERKLLDQGFNREVQQRMMDVQHDLLKLKDAGLLQGKEEQREATTNVRDFNNTSKSDIPDASRYFNNKEILNRQVLPLQPQFRNRVKEYFKQND